MILIPATVWGPLLHSMRVCCLFCGKPRECCESPLRLYIHFSRIRWDGFHVAAVAHWQPPWLMSACCPYNVVAAIAYLGSCNTTTGTVLEHPRAFTQEPQNSILPDWPSSRKNGITRKCTYQRNQVNLGKSLRSNARKSVTYLDVDIWNNSTPTDFHSEVVYLRLS